MTKFKDIDQTDFEQFRVELNRRLRYNFNNISPEQLNTTLNELSGILSLAKGGTGTSLAAPAGDRILFYDLSAGKFTWLTIVSPLAISGTQLGLGISSDFEVKNDVLSVKEAWSNLTVPPLRVNAGFDDVIPGFTLYKEIDEWGTGHVDYNISMPSNWREGSTIHPVVKWRQAVDDDIIFKIDYFWYNPGDEPPALASTYTMGTYQFTYVEDTLSQLSKGTGIDGTGKEIGSVLAMRLYRDDLYDDVVSVDNLSLDIKIDSIGSSEQFSK